MNITSMRFGLLVLAILVGISSVYATHHCEVNGWYVNMSGSNISFSRIGDVSVGETKELLPQEDPEFSAYCWKFGDIEGVFIYGGTSYNLKCKVLKSTIKVDGIQKSFYLNNESLVNQKHIDTTFVFLPEEVSGSGDSYEWHIEGVIKYQQYNGNFEYYNETFSDSGTISVGGVISKKYFVENPKINLGKGGFVMVMKCYKEDNKTIINVTIFPTYEEVNEESPGYSNKGYFGSGNITINNETFPFEFRIGDAYWICFGNTNLIKTYTWNVTNAPTVGSNQPVKSPIPPMAIIIALLAIPIIVLRKLN